MENTNTPEEQPKKKPITIMVIGHVGHGSACATATAIAEARMMEKGHNIIVVESIEELSAKTGMSVEEFNSIEELKTDALPLRNRAIELKSMMDEEPMQIRLSEMQNHNPWPSPKGRNGKRKW